MLCPRGIYTSFLFLFFQCCRTRLKVSLRSVFFQRLQQAIVFRGVVVPWEGRRARHIVVLQERNCCHVAEDRSRVFDFRVVDSNLRSHRPRTTNKVYRPSLGQLFGRTRVKTGGRDVCRVVEEALASKFAVRPARGHMFYEVALVVHCVSPRDCDGVPVFTHMLSISRRRLPQVGKFRHFFRNGDRQVVPIICRFLQEARVGRACIAICGIAINYRLRVA